MMLRPLTAAVLAAACALTPLVRAQSTKATLDVDVNKPGVTIPPNFFGLMTEEINHAYDGGLYAELIRNRTFQDDANAPAHWSTVGDGKLELDRADPVNAANPVTGKLTLAGGKGGIANDGFWGIPVKPDTTYTASFYVKAVGISEPIMAAIVGDDGVEYAKATSQPATDKWQKQTVTLKTAGGFTPTAKAKFVLSTTGTGTVSFSHVSLFPPTYKDTPGGLRADLMELMAAMKPAFVRLPGGNYLEGNNFKDRFDWKKQIGPVDERPGHMGCWSYRSSDGMGLTQMLLWCKQLDAEPVLAVFAGYTLRGAVVKASSPELQQYVDEALEEIEYVTGGPDTKWGKQRIADGFAEPFKLRYVEIGNEDWFDKSGSYDGRYTQFHDAIKAKYPDVKLIATMPVTTRTPDLYDDHSYRSPNQMAVDSGGFDAPKDGSQGRKTQYNGGRHYGQFGRGGPPLFYGEWASQEGKPTPTLRSGLADAVFVMGLERNADLVHMQCYAPLFVNVNPGAWQWGTNLIGYDATTAFGSPSYYAQVMLAQNKGDRVLPATLKVATKPAAATPAAHGAVGLGAWRTNVEYKDFTVTGPDGKALLPGKPTESTDNWAFTGPAWQVTDGTFRPAAADGESWAVVGDPKWTDYTIRVKARKLGGEEGFLVLWHAADAETYNWLNVGGWANTRTQAEAANGGNRTAYGRSADFKVQENKWYDLRIEVRGDTARCFIDDKLVTQAKDRPVEPQTQPMYASATAITASNEVVVRVVNYSADPIETTLNLRGAGTVKPAGKATVLSGEPKDVNTVAEPKKIAPKEEAVTDASATMRRTFPPYSLTVLRLETTPQK